MTEAPVTAVAFGRLYLSGRPRASAAKRAFGLLQRVSRIDDAYGRLAWLTDLARYVHNGPSVPFARGEALPAHSSDGRVQRLMLVHRATMDVEAWRAGVARILGTLFDEAEGVRAFSDVGLPMEPGFLREATDRVAQRLLPRAPEPHRLAQLLQRAFPRLEDANWLAVAPREVLAAAVQLFYVEPNALERATHSLRACIAYAVSVLASRVCAHGLAPDIGDRLPRMSPAHHPFLQLPRACETLMALMDRDPADPEVEEASTRARRLIEACRHAVTEVHAHLDQFGISVDLVYRLDVVIAQLGRLEDLVAFLLPNFSAEAPHDVAVLLAAMVDAQFASQSLRALVQQSSARLARKVIERAGHSGEHYITETWGEWWRMLGAGIGGGVLTAGTTAVKTLIGTMRVAPFFGGLFASLNYSLSFLTMQMFGFVLATKQPSMTAAALASSLERVGATRPGGAAHVRSLDRLVDMIARITRSQLAAVLGNVGAVIPAAWAFNWVYRRRTGHPFFDAHYAEHFLGSMHLYKSGTLIFAAITGVLLWMSSVVAGWFENWVVYRKLPEAIAHHRVLVRVIGRDRAKRLGDRVLHAASGFGGNLSVGFLLGMTPTIGAFFGVGLEVRHITLATGAMTFSVCALGVETMRSHEFLWALGGLAAVLALNFTVSFNLALAVALRAREVRSGDFFHLLRTLIVRLFRTPFDFILPPRRPRVRPSIVPLAPEGPAAHDVERAARPRATP